MVKNREITTITAPQKKDLAEPFSLHMYSK